MSWREQYRAHIAEHEQMILREQERLQKLGSDIRALHEELVAKASPIEEMFQAVATSIHRRKGAITQLIALLQDEKP